MSNRDNEFLSIYIFLNEILAMISRTKIFELYVFLKNFLFKDMNLSF
jgi:hypothetical protein